MAGKVREIRSAECLLAASREILIVLPHSFYCQISGNRLDWVPDFKFSSASGGDPDPPLLNLLPHICLPNR